MIPLTLAEVAHLLGGTVVPASAGQVVIDEVGTDSRALPAGRVLFVALPGVHADGHRFVAAAARAGACAALVSAVVDDPVGEVGIPAVVVGDTWGALLTLGREVRRRVAPRTVAVTGSVGKTTVKDLTAAAVGAGRRVHAARGSFNNELGVPLTLLGLTEDVEVLVAEVGARHVGDIAASAPAVAPDIAMVTAVAAVHLEVFGTIDDVARGKRELVESLGPGGTAVLNADDPRVAAMAGAAPGAVLRVGMHAAGLDLTVEEVVLDEAARPHGRARTPWGDVPVQVPVAGRHQLTNALFALAAAGHLGVDLEAAAAALARAPVSPWRGEVRRAGGLTVLNDAYNANPLAMRAALDTLMALPGTRRIAVLGTMAELGPTAASDHEDIGRHLAALGIDLVVVVGDGDAHGYTRGARAAGLDAVVEVADAPGAVEALRAELGAGDVVLVKASRVAGLERVADALAPQRAAASVRDTDPATEREPRA